MYMGARLSTIKRNAKRSCIVQENTFQYKSMSRANTEIMYIITHDLLVACKWNTNPALQMYRPLLVRHQAMALDVLHALHHGGTIC